MSPFIFLQETSLTTNSLISPKGLRVWENNAEKKKKKKKAMKTFEKGQS